MKKKITWTLMSFLMVVVLVLASCGVAEEEEEAAPVVGEEEEEEPVVTPTVEEEEEEPEVVLPTGPEMDYNAAGVLQEIPQHGGTFILALGAWYIQHISPMKYVEGSRVKELIYDAGVQADWFKGPAGTQEHMYDGYYIGQEFRVGSLMESWEFPDDYSTIWHVREGVRFQNKAPAWGREYTADDTIRIITALQSAPWAGGWYITPETPDEDRARIEKIDDYTVIYIVFGSNPIRPGFGDIGLWHFAPEMVERETPEGELPWEWDWRYACGTGPFILNDYVADSAWEFVRNDDYWMKDPLWPDLQLPYVDKIIGLDIPDVAVYHSALQTGKIDLGELNWDKAETFKVQVPDMLYATGAATFSRTIQLLTNIEPYSDARVRRALHLGFDNRKMLEEYYGGYALLVGWPLQPGSEGYTPYEDLPDYLRELWEYHPDKAKALLAEAGYPNGFDCTILVGWQDAEDIAVIAADDWKTIGVNATVERIDWATWSGYLWQKAYPGITVNWWGNTSPSGFAYYCGGVYPPPQSAFGLSVDPSLEEDYQKWLSMTRPEQAEERAAFWKEVNLRVMYDCHLIYTPTPYPMYFWWPWLKNYYGISHLQSSVEVGSSSAYKYLWIDQDLKYQMTGTSD